MHNNKNLLKTEEKSKSELRKMFPHDDEAEIDALKDIEKSHKQSGASLKNTTTRS